jgi:hypothetical protein
VLKYGYSGAGGLLTVRLLNESAFTQTFQRNISTGRTYILSSVLKDIKVLDILGGMQNIFNLYFETNNNNRVIRIEPKTALLKPIFKKVQTNNELSNPNQLTQNLLSI